MAITYTGANGWATQIGKVLKALNTYLTLGQTTLAADLTDIRTILLAGNSGNRDELLAAAVSFYGNDEGSSGIRRTATATWRRALSNLINSRLLDFNTIITELNLTDRDINLVLNRLIDQMIIDAASVNASVGTLGGASAASGNVGNGAVLTSLVLDGYSSPGNNMPPHQRYRGVNSELLGSSDTMTILCTGDSQGSSGGRTTEGAEQWRWYGNPSYDPLSWEAEGSGEGPGLVTSNGPGYGIIKNKDFEVSGASAATTLFPNWVIDNGTAGTHVVVEATAADVYRGIKAMRFDSTASPPATVQVSQLIQIAQLQARRRYCLSLRTKASASIAAGDITVQFEGTGYTAATGTAEVQTVQISGTPSGGSYTLTWAGPTGSQTTGAIAWDATSATVQTALRLLTGLESVVVSTSAGSPPDVTHQITFNGTYGNISQLTSASSLTGGTPVITHATTTPGVDGERIYMPAASLPTTQSLRYFWITMPASIPIDNTFKLVIKWTGTPTASKSVWFDSIAFQPAVWHNGHAAVVVAGSTPFKAGDRFTYAASNSEGVFQKWFRQVHGVQLPSNNAAGETIADSLAT